METGPNRRSVLAGLSATPLVGWGERARASGANPPNVLYIMVDQLRAHALSCYGETNITTPRIDEMAARGARFEWAFNAQSICVPARAAMLGGVFPSSIGVTDNFNYPGDIPTIAHAFTDAGYRSAYLGKWHLDEAPARQYLVPPGWQRRGFDDLWAVNRSNHRYTESHLFFDTANKVKPLPADTYQPKWYTDLALDYLDDHVASGTTDPFFLMLSFGGPHAPPDGTDWASMIPQGYLNAINPAALAFRPNVPQWAREATPWLATPPHAFLGARAYLHAYYAMVLSLDTQVGRLAKRLLDLGLENTIVVFTSDHGEQGGSMGRFGKTQPYEESNRVPLIVSWPGRIANGTVIDFPISHVDLVPTLTGLASTTFPGVTHGRDVSEQLLGIGGDPLQSVYMEGKVITDNTPPIPAGTGFRSVFTPEWYYVERVGGTPAMLHHLPRDPWYRTNLVDDPNASAEQAMMSHSLHQWLARTATGSSDTGLP